MPRRGIGHTGRAFGHVLTNVEASPVQASQGPLKIPESPVQIAPAQMAQVQMAPNASPSLRPHAPTASPAARVLAASHQPIATSQGMLQMLQPLQQPVFGQLSQVGKHRPAAAPAMPPQNLKWTIEQTAEFFDPKAVQEANRQAAWQQYYQQVAYMQASMTPQQFQQWQLFQSQQYQHSLFMQQQQQQYAMMMQTLQKKQQKLRKPRVKKASSTQADCLPSDKYEVDMPAPPLVVKEEETFPLSSVFIGQEDTGEIPQALVAAAALVEASPAVVEASAPKYEGMSRSDLVVLAKQRGIKANGKTADMVEALMKIDAEKAQAIEAVPMQQSEVPELEHLMSHVTVAASDKESDKASCPPREEEQENEELMEKATKPKKGASKKKK